MNTSNEVFIDVADYISKSDKNVREILRNIRALIREIAPTATESIAYGMPAYKLNGKPLVYFAAFKNHIGFYATPESHEAFAEELARYNQGKGSVQFPLNQPVPYELIRKMTTYKAESLHG